MIPNREQAHKVLTEYTQGDFLIKHALSVEAVMCHYAKKLGEDIEYWGAIGLMHDLDYEKYPEQHCKKVVEILKEKGIDERFINSIISHAYGMCSDVKPVHIMEKILYTTDELTGLVIAAALMRPSKSVMDLEVSSLKKKYKDKKFAAGVDRSVIEKGCEMWNSDLGEVMGEVILAMRNIADEIGLGLNKD